MADWSDAGKEEGLDPLAMLTAIERVYQDLLPGFSSVTTRLRHYAFHCWWIRDYADLVHHTGKAVFQERTRKVEFLYALLNAFHNPAETGVGGALFARASIASGRDPVDFRGPSSYPDDEQSRYLRPRGGEFPGVYGAQMIEMGLFARGSLLGGEESPGADRLVPTKLGRRLAAAFDETVGDAGALFRKIVTRDDVVRRSELAQLATFALGAVPCQKEAELLQDVLMGRAQEAEPEEDLSGLVRTKAARRRATLAEILRVARLTGAPVSSEMLRWFWMEDPRAEANEGAATVWSWRCYQAGDLLRVTYEQLLRLAVRHLSTIDGGMTMAELLDDLLGEIPQDDLGTWLADLDAHNQGRTLNEMQAGSFADEAEITDILGPLARLYATLGTQTAALFQAFPDEPARQSVASELTWLAERRSQSAREVIAELIRFRVLERHIRVAMRKLLRQNAYTFLFELENGLLRARTTRSVAPSGPRLTTAVRFLQDAGLLDNAGRGILAA